MNREPLSKTELALMVLRCSHAMLEGPTDDVAFHKLTVELEDMALRILDEQRHPEPPVIPVDLGDCPY